MNKFTRYAAAGAVAVLAVAGTSNRAEALQFNVGWVNLAGLNAAYSCSHSAYGEGGSYMDSTSYGSRSSYTSGCAANHTSNAASSVVTATETLRAATVQTLGIITNRIAQVRLAQDRGELDPVSLTLSQDGKIGAVGLAGGNAKKGIGVWIQGAYTWVENDAAVTAFDGTIAHGMVGVDYKIGDRVLIGVSGGYESSDLDTTFNKGSIEGSGYSVAPYLSFRINKTFSVDLTGGYAWLSYDMDRKDAGNDQKWTGETDATRAFGLAQVNADFNVKKWALNVNGGALYTSEDRDAFTEKSNGETRAIAAQTTDLGQAFIGTRIGYDFGKFMPYVLARGEFDFSKDDITVGSGQTNPGDSDFGLRVGGGVNIFAGSFVTGTLQGETVLFRDDYTEHKALAKLRVDF
jgi:hypothetical protein